MTDLPENLPNDPELLKELIRVLANERKDFYERLRLLEERYKREMRNKYGPKSESLDPAQLRLFAEAQKQDEQPSAEEPPEPRSEESGEPVKKSGHGRRKPSRELPRKPVIHDVPECEKTCPRCTWTRELCGREVTLQLDYNPGFAFYWEHIRLKYACRTCDANVVTAPMPKQPIDRGIPASGMLAHIAISKLADHLPLYRLEGILSRQGLVLSRSTMCDWMSKTAKIVEPVYKCMIKRIKQSKVIWTDDTPIKVLDRDLKKRTKTGRIWVYRGDSNNPFIAFHYTPSRRRDGPVEFLKNYKGYIQADAFAGYDCTFIGDGAKEVACMAHARRKFVEAMESSHAACSEVLLVIQKLYDVERKTKTLTAEERAAIRRLESIPLLDELGKILSNLKLLALPKSSLGKAVTYALNNWPALNVFASDGDLTIDNNLAENAIRTVALGRKNWLFAGSDSGGETCAIISSLVSTCRRLSIDPFLYLRTLIDMLTENPQHDPELLLPGVLQLDERERKI